MSRKLIGPLYCDKLKVFVCFLDYDGLRIHQLMMRQTNKVFPVTKEDNLMPELTDTPQKYTDSLHSTHDTRLHNLKAVLYSLTVRETQRMKRLILLDKEIRLILIDLNTTLSDRNALQIRLQEAVEINKGLETEVNVMRNAADVVNSQLLEVKQAARFGEEVKTELKIAQADNRTLTEVMKAKDDEMLQLKEYVTSKEEISRQLQQRLINSKDEAHLQTELLDTAISENEKLCNEKIQLTTENELLHREINQLKETLDQQSKQMEEQKYDAGKPQEKTNVEGMYHLHYVSVLLSSTFTAWE